MQAISVGPWVFSVGVLAILLGLAAAHAAAGFMKKRGYGDAGPALWWLLLAALVAARGAFVWRQWQGYRLEPWTTLDIRDGGFAIRVGIAVLVLAASWWWLRRPRLRCALPVAVACGLVAWGAVTLAAGQLRQAAHPPVPDVVLRRLDGGTTTLAALRGRPMVVNLWATWCGPCRREMPMLVAASQAMPDVRFVFVDQDESAAAVRAFLDSEKLAPRHVLIDTGSRLARLYHAPGYPTTLFLDAKGRLRDMRVGPLSRATLQAHLTRVTSRSPIEKK